MWAYLPHDTSKDHDIMLLMVHETSYIFIPLDSDFGSRTYFEVVRLGTCPVPFGVLCCAERFRSQILDQNRRNIRNMYILDHNSQIRYIHNKVVDRTNEQIFVL